jgi:hypothetical protein
MRRVARVAGAGWRAPAPCTPSLVRFVFLITVSSLLLTACGSGASRDASPGQEERAGHEVNGALVATADDRGSFNTPCGYTHSATDDPIVHHEMPGMSHRHDFFGAMTTSSSSDADSLLDGGTTCRSVADHSAYWAPSLLVGGVPVEPLEVNAYYRVPVGADAAQVTPPPNGLEMIAGSPDATSAQDTSVVSWACGSSTDLSPVPLHCPAGAEQRLRLRFDPCWDGEHLSSSDHVSHLAALGDDGACPASHPVLLPEIDLDLRYRSSGSAAPLTLASGPVTGGHGDVLVAWDEDHIADEVATCLNRNNNCDVVSESTRLGFDELG